MGQDTIIKVDHVYMKFNLASERVDNFKEYVIKTLKKQIGNNGKESICVSRRGDDGDGSPVDDGPEHDFQPGRPE